jgi:hypothetical protein
VDEAEFKTTKILGGMEAAIRDKLLKISGEFNVEYINAHTAYLDMPAEIKAHPMYKQLGMRLDAVEALLNTLNHTAASFPAPAE